MKTGLKGELTSILVEAPYVIPMNGRGIIKDGAVYIEDDRIVAVGGGREVRRVVSRLEHHIHVEKGVILPGLINLHVHLAQALLRGVVPDNLKLIPWLRDWVWPLQGVYDEEDGRVSAELCIMEMLRGGTTTFLESLLHQRYGFDGIAEVVRDSGIRGYLSKSVMDQPGYATEQGIMHPGMIEDERSLEVFKAMYSKWDGAADGRIRVWIGLRTPGACSDSLYREASRLAEELGSGITMHLAEVREDLEYFKSRGTIPAGFLKKLSLLGKRRVYVHCVWLSKEDMRMLANSGSSIAHCPSSNLKLGSGIAPVLEMRKTGVTVGLGTDGGPSNDTYDMLREIRLAALLQKGRTLRPESFSAWDALEMATIEGAKALGVKGELGALKPGMKADLITVSFNRPGLHPLSDPVSLLAYSSTGLDVRDVIVDGKLVVENGRVLWTDEEKVMEKAQRRLLKILEKSGKLKEVEERWLKQR